MRNLVTSCVVVIMVLAAGTTVHAAAIDRVNPGMSAIFKDFAEEGWVDFWWYQPEDLPNDPVEVITLNHWVFKIEIKPQATNTLTWDAWHKTNPHGEGAAPHWTGSQANAWGNNGAASTSLAHPGVPNHGDSYDIIWSWQAASNRMHVTFEGTHVPEPATICLLGLGGMFLIRKKQV